MSISQTSPSVVSARSAFAAGDVVAWRHAGPGGEVCGGGEAGRVHPDLGECTGPPLDDPGENDQAVTGSIARNRCTPAARTCPTPATGSDGSWTAAPAPTSPDSSASLAPDAYADELLACWTTTGRRGVSNAPKALIRRSSASDTAPATLRTIAHGSRSPSVWTGSALAGFTCHPDQARSPRSVA